MLAALLLAAGRSERASEDKSFADLGGKPLLRWSAERLAAEPRIEQVLLVERPSGPSPAAEAIRGLRKPYGVCLGGATRADSVRSGLRSLAAEVILVHDAARPFLDAETLTRVLDAFERYGAAAAALPVTDTLRRGDEEWAGETLEREGVWAMQTPQVFARETLERAYARADAPTDCAAAVVAAGGRVRLVRGHPLNFKVTTAEDLAYARAVVAAGLVRPPLAGDT